MTTTMIKHTQVDHKADFAYTSFKDLPIYDERCMPRWAVVNKAYYRLPDKEEIYRTETRDLTYGGVSLYIAPNVRVNQKISMKIYLSPEKSFEAHGTVIWKSTCHDDSCYAGILFDLLPQETQELILNHAF